MSFASEKLYNGYLRLNMPTIVSRVKVKEIIVHLPCLTLHDRETIEAKRETHGNFDGMVLLLDCLKRREGWPEQFIRALEACEQKTIAAEMRAAYDALKGANTPPPEAKTDSPPTTVTRAHVHPAPAAEPPAIPAASALPPPLEEEAAAPEPLPPTSETTQTAVASEAAPEPPRATPEVAPPQATPPPPPESPHADVEDPQGEFRTHQEPEENSEESSDLRDVSAIPEQGGDSLVSTVTPPVSPRDGQLETDTEAAAAAAELGPPQSPSPPPPPQEESSFATLTPEKPPVQDTAPPADKTPAVVTETEETTEPATAQDIERISQTETASSSGSQLDPTPDDGSLCKPTRLVSIQEPIQGRPTVPEHNAPAEPYSGDSGRLEMSRAASEPPRLENGVAPNHGALAESHDGTCSSWDTQVNVVQVSEEPSLLDMEAHVAPPPPPPPAAQILNGEAAGKIPAPLPTFTVTAHPVPSLDVAAGDGVRLPGPAPETPRDPEKDNAASRTMYVATAAGVGAIALLMAWKFKN